MDAVDEMRNLMKSLPQTDEDVVAALDDAAAANAIAAADDLSSGELLAFDFRAANNNSSTQPMAVDGQASVLPLPQRIKKAYHAIIEAVQTSPVFAETTQIKRVVRYLDRLKSIQACLLHHARDPSRRVHLPLTMFDDVIESQSHVLCYKLAQADDAAGRGSPALAQLVAVLHEWRDDAVMNTLASVAGKAHDPRTRLRAFVLFGDICGRATERFIKLALERVDCDPALKVRTAALQSIADIMPTVVESADLAPLTPSIGKQLVDVANKDSVSKMRAGAVRVLAEAFEPNRSIVAVAVARVNDKEALVREAACEVLKGLPFDILARFVTWNDWTQLLACLNDQGEATRPVLDTLFVSLLRTQMERTSTAALRRQQLIDTLSSLQMVKNDNTFGPMVKRHMDIIISMIQE